MSPDEIARFHSSEPLWLHKGSIRVTLLPERGGRVAGLWLGNAQLVFPIEGLTIETESGGGVFETSFSQYKVAQTTSALVSMQYTVQREDFSGLILSKKVSIHGAEVVFEFSRRNSGDQPRSILDTIRFSFSKPFGLSAYAELRKPEKRTLTMPLSYLGHCSSGADVTLNLPSGPICLSISDTKLRELRLWSRPTDLSCVAIFIFEQNTLEQCGSSSDYQITLRVCG